MPAQTNRDSDKFMLRLPEGMRQAIKEAAIKSGRSMNAEIVHRLEASFRSSSIPSDAFEFIMERDKIAAAQVADLLYAALAKIERWGDDGISVEDMNLVEDARNNASDQD